MTDVAAYEHRRCVIKSTTGHFACVGTVFSSYYYDCPAFLFLANKALHSGPALFKTTEQVFFPLTNQFTNIQPVI